VEDSYLGGVDVVDARQALHLPCTVTALTVQVKISLLLLSFFWMILQPCKGTAATVQDSYPFSVERSIPYLIRVNVQGNERTRRQLIEKEMKAALKAKTHAELAKELVNANARLYDLDIFRDATCFVDAGERDEDVTVRVVVEEKGTHTVRKSPPNLINH